MTEYFQGHNYVIESEIELPPRKSQGTPLFPWADMRVGDSFATGPKFNRWKHQTIVAGSAAAYADSKEPSFRIRMRPEGKGVRVWRVA
jgi:hypothetical protein